MLMKKKVSIIIIDGEEYSISEDRKNIKGKEKKYTIDEFREEKAKKIPIFVAPPKTVREGVVFGFSKKEDHEKWLKENGLYEDHELQKKILEKVKHKLSSEGYEKFKKHQIEEVKEATTKFEEFMKKHNLKSDEIEKIQKLLRDDPYFGKHTNSIYLYHDIWFQRWGIVLPGKTYAWEFCGRFYNDFRDFGFNDKASSYWQTDKAILFEHINFEGAQFYCHQDYIGDLRAYGWNDKVSSALVL